MRGYICDRCNKISGGTVDRGNEEAPPENWREMWLPVRGSGGARSSRYGHICDDCDDSLYEWLHGAELES